MAAVPYAFGYSSTTAVERQPLYADDVWLSISGLPPTANPRGGAFYTRFSATTAPVPSAGGRYACAGLALMVPGNFGDGTSYQPVLTDALGKQVPYDRSLWVADSELGVVQFAADPVGLGYSPPFALLYYRYTGATAAVAAAIGTVQTVTAGNANVTVTGTANVLVAGTLTTLTNTVDGAGQVIHSLAGGSAAGLANYVIGAGNAFNVVSTDPAELFSIDAGCNVRIGNSSHTASLYVGEVDATSNSKIQLDDQTGFSKLTTRDLVVSDNVGGQYIKLDNTSPDPVLTINDNTTNRTQISSRGFLGSSSYNQISMENGWGSLNLSNIEFPEYNVTLDNGNAGSTGMIVTDPTYISNYGTSGMASQVKGTNQLSSLDWKQIIVTNGGDGETTDRNISSVYSNGLRNESINSIDSRNVAITHEVSTIPTIQVINYESGDSTTITDTSVTSYSFVGTLTGSSTRIIVAETTANITYYPTFADAAYATGANMYISVGAPLTFNPSTGTLSSSKFAGNLIGTAANATAITVTDTNAAGTYYPTFVSASGASQTLRADTSVTPFAYNPNTGTLTVATVSGALSGNASSATNVRLTSDTSSGTYFLPFAKTSGTGIQALFIDDVTGPLTYNPSTSSLSTAQYVASAASSTNTITSNSMAVANAGGTLTINQASLTASTTYAINGINGVNIQYNGTTQSSITAVGVQETILTSQGTATYSSPTLTLVTTALAPYPTSYTNLITFSGSTVAQTISAISVPANMPVNGVYMVYIANNNTAAGAVTVNATALGAGIKTTYTLSVVIPVSGFALGTLTKVGASTFIWSINVVA